MAIYHFNSVTSLAERILDKLYEKSYEFGRFWELAEVATQEDFEQLVIDAIEENTERTEQ